MDQKKVVAVDGSYDGDQESIEPWIMPSYTEQDLDDTLDAFDRLLSAIEGHWGTGTSNSAENMPRGPAAAVRSIPRRTVPPTPPGFVPPTLAGNMPSSIPIDYGLINPEALDASGTFPDSFAYRFLARAHNPRFTHIAPGLRIAQQQPFTSVPIVEGRIRPFLLFESLLPAFHETQRAPWGENVPVSPFPNDFENVPNLPYRSIPY